MGLYKIGVSIYSVKALFSFTMDSAYIVKD